MMERRVVARRRTFLKGVLSCQNGATSEDALVRNLSESGALIELAHPRAADAFDLIIPARQLHAAAKLAWRSGQRFGVSFEAAPAAPPKPARPPAPRDEGY